MRPAAAIRDEGLNQMGYARELPRSLGKATAVPPFLSRRPPVAPGRLIIARNQRPLNKPPRIPRTMRRPVVPFSSLITASVIAEPKVSRGRMDRAVERPTRDAE